MSASQTTRRLSALIPVLIVGLIAARANGSILWFDENAAGTGRSAADFGDFEADYQSFLGAADMTVTFDEFSTGTAMANQYAYGGVTFQNTDGGPHSSLSRTQSEGGSIAENVTGYDGSYMPDGNPLLVKFDNDNSDTPFTILFDEPVSTVGAFVGMGVQGNVHSLTVSVYDSAEQLLSQTTVDSWLWESNPSKQNYETFFGVRSTANDISRVEILNDAKANYANALILDNLAFSSTPVPEPMTCGLLAFGAFALIARKAQR